MRLLITTDAVGGVWDQANRLARAMAERHEVVLAVAGPTQATPRAAQVQAQAARAPDVRLERLEGPLEWMPGGPEAVPAIHQQLRALVAKHSIDVVHANAFGHVLPDVPTVLTAHSTLHGWWRATMQSKDPAIQPPKEWDAYAEVVRQALRDAHLVLAPTQAMLDELDLYGGAMRSRVAHNGIDARGEMTRSPFVLSGGRLWDEGKGFSILDEASSAIPWPVHVTGPRRGPMGQEAPIRRMVHLGHLERPELDRLYAQAGLYVNPALYEPFGLGALEAAARATPLVLPDLPSQRELWAGAARFFAPGDPDDLANVVARLAYDSAERHRLGQAAQSRARRYTIRPMVDTHMQAYQETREIACTP